MELYLEPIFKYTKKGRFKKGQIAWNKGLKQWTTKDEKKKAATLARLAEGRKQCWKKRDRNIVHNATPTAVYDLQGNFLSVHLSCNRAAEAYGQCPRNVVGCIHGKRKRVGDYQFRAAKVEVFRGEKLVRKSPIEPYKRRSRWSGIKEQENNNHKSISYGKIESNQGIY